MRETRTAGGGFTRPTVPRTPHPNRKGHRMTSYTETRETQDDGTVVVTRTPVPGPHDVHDGVDYAMNGNGKPLRIVDADPDPATAQIGSGHDDDYIFTTRSGKTIRVRSMAKGKNPPPFAMMEAEATKNFSAMTILVLKAKSGKDWPAVQEILREMEEDEFKEFSEGYSVHSGVTPGE